MKKLALLAFAVTLAAACGEATLQEPEGTETLDSEIVNGTADKSHKAVGKVRFSGKDVCTGTLVGKRTVLTAAHCVLGRASETSFVLEGKVYPAEEVVAHPRWDNEADDGEGTNDIAVLRLEKAPPIQPSPISTHAPALGQHLTLVGYGITSEDAQDFGTRRIAYNAIGALGSTKLYFSSSSGVGTTCYGDSGGPAFSRVNGEEVQVGVTSGGLSPCEWGDAWDTRVDLFAGWISSVSGGDVVSGGSGLGSSGLGADTEKPKVRITTPKSYAAVDAGTVLVKASATDDTGIARVELWVDGELRQTRIAPAGPYSFTTKLSEGWHELRVWAHDAAGHAGRYTVSVQAL
ncbi:MAG TPA: trypsin-like serine protease [Myxococcales bacterium]|jgi:secreted trypsin-like serine protease